MSQSQPLRVEHPEIASLIRCRTIGGVQWFMNNSQLEHRILGYVAKYVEKYEVALYSFVFCGSYIELVAKFPKCNRARFMRDLNARITEAVRACVPEFPGGPFFERRYSEQALPLAEDIQEQVVASALHAVEAGICKNREEYPGYNSWDDASEGVVRQYEVVEWSKYKAAKRYNEQVTKERYTTEYGLVFTRLPGLEKLGREAYAKKLDALVGGRATQLLKEQKALGQQSCQSAAELRKMAPTSRRMVEKTKARMPLVRTACSEAKRRFLAWYFSIYSHYKKAVEQYQRGTLNASFPPRTYRPPGVVV